MTKLVFVALALAAFAAQAQTRVRGIVEKLDGNVLAVKEAAQKATLAVLGDRSEIIALQPIALGDIKSGDFLGVTSMKRPDGSLVAVEVRRFLKPLNPGHRPFDGRDDQTMTNATVAATVQSTAGRELTMTYEGGSQKIAVPPSAMISTMVPGSRAQLVPGARVSFTAEPGADGRLVVQRLQVAPPAQ